MNLMSGNNSNNFFKFFFIFIFFLIDLTPLKINKGFFINEMNLFEILLDKLELNTKSISNFFFWSS